MLPTKNLIFFFLFSNSFFKKLIFSKSTFSFPIFSYGFFSSFLPKEICYVEVRHFFPFNNLGKNPEENYKNVKLKGGFWWVGQNKKMGRRGSLGCIVKQSKEKRKFLKLPWDVSFIFLVKERKYIYLLKGVINSLYLINKVILTFFYILYKMLINLLTIINDLYITAPKNTFFYLLFCYLTLFIASFLIYYTSPFFSFKIIKTTQGSLINYPKLPVHFLNYPKLPVLPSFSFLATPPFLGVLLNKMRNPEGKFSKLLISHNHRSKLIDKKTSQNVKQNPIFAQKLNKKAIKLNKMSVKLNILRLTKKASKCNPFSRNRFRFASLMLCRSCNPLRQFCKVKQFCKLTKKAITLYKKSKNFSAFFKNSSPVCQSQVMYKSGLPSAFLLNCSFCKFKQLTRKNEFVFRNRKVFINKKGIYKGVARC